jgi:two-component system sensor histidine kinase BaeS
VFERFYRVDRARDRDHGGSGIGLAIVKALVLAHGGAVNMSSDGPGQGGTFTVILPTIDAAEPIRT